MIQPQNLLSLIAIIRDESKVRICPLNQAQDGRLVDPWLCYTSWSRLNITQIPTGNSPFITCQFRNVLLQSQTKKSSATSSERLRNHLWTSYITLASTHTSSPSSAMQSSSTAQRGRVLRRSLRSLLGRKKETGFQQPLINLGMYHQSLQAILRKWRDCKPQWILLFDRKSENSWNKKSNKWKKKYMFILYFL